MLKIFCNHERQDISYTYSVGMSFPDIKGKLLRVEVNGKELLKLLEVKEIPACFNDSSYLAWDGKAAGSILKTFRELFDK